MVADVDQCTRVTQHHRDDCRSRGLVLCNLFAHAQAVETLAPVAAAAKGAPAPVEHEIGAGISSGEMPHAQACTLYLLRIGVIEQLSEAGQRAMLEKCARLMRRLLRA